MKTVTVNVYPFENVHMKTSCILATTILLTTLMEVNRSKADDGSKEARDTAEMFRVQTRELFARLQRLRLESRAQVTLPTFDASGNVTLVHKITTTKREPFADAVLLTTEDKWLNDREKTRQIQEHRITVDNRLLTAQAYFDESGKQLVGNDVNPNVTLLLTDRKRLHRETPIRSELEMYELGDGTGFVFGFLSGDFLISYLSDDANCTSRVDGSDQQLVAVSKLGSVNFKLSKQHGGQPFEIDVLKKSTDLYLNDEAGKYTLNAIANFPGGPKGHADLKKWTIREIRWRAEVQRFLQSRSGQWYPSEYTHSRVIEYEDGRHEEKRAVVTASERALR